MTSPLSRRVAARQRRVHKFFAMEEPWRKLPILAEQGSPAVAHGEPNRGVGGFPSRSGKGDSGAVKRRSAVQVCRFLQADRQVARSLHPSILQRRSGPPRCNRRRRRNAEINYKLGSIYAVVTALLLSVQEPFSFLAAKRLSVTQFVFLTQVALVMSIPLLITHQKSRSDLVSLLGNATNYYRFGSPVSYRHGWFVAVQARVEQRASDHHLGDYQPAALFSRLWWRCS